MGEDGGAGKRPFGGHTMVVECVATVALAAIAVPSVVAGLEYNDRTVTSRFDDGDQHGVPVEALEHKPAKEQAGHLWMQVPGHSWMQCVGGEGKVMAYPWERPWLGGE